MASYLNNEEYSFVTPYFLVYGTLRLGQGNYDNYIKETGEHLGTFRLNGFKLSGISCESSDEDTSVVVDLFRLKTDTKLDYIKMYESNCIIDLLETGYKITPISFELNGIEIVAKLYTRKIYENQVINTTGDYLSPKYYKEYPILVPNLIEI